MPLMVARKASDAPCSPFRDLEIPPKLERDEDAAVDVGSDMALVEVEGGMCSVG